jgi:hypothetical protein
MPLNSRENGTCWSTYAAAQLVQERLAEGGVQAAEQLG